jgi:hypothetical protein
MGNVNLCAISLRYGEVAWELAVLRGTSERLPRGHPGQLSCCQEPCRTVQLGLFVQLCTAYV